MSQSLESPAGQFRAACDDCEWTLERATDAGDGLTAEQNQDIAERVARFHAFDCDAAGEDWGERADVSVELDMTGGDGP